MRDRDNLVHHCRLTPHHIKYFAIKYIFKFRNTPLKKLFATNQLIPPFQHNSFQKQQMRMDRSETFPDNQDGDDLWLTTARMNLTFGGKTAKDCLFYDETFLPRNKKKNGDFIVWKKKVRLNFWCLGNIKNIHLQVTSNLKI